MSVKSTKYISREHAIERIKKVCELVEAKKYFELEGISFEHNEDVETFVNSEILFDYSNLENWTNRMLEDEMDKPFYRHSMFDNYIVRIMEEQL